MTSQPSSSGCPDSDVITGNRVVKSWASHLTFPWLGFHICKLRMITAQFLLRLLGGLKGLM